MKIAMIAPTKYLEKFSTLWTMQMCLSHEAVRNEEYLNFFKDRKNKGEWVLMDNGAHEGERVDGQKLYDLALKVNPSCVILPDVLDNYQDTYNDTIAFHKEFARKIKEAWIEMMAVPQGETFELYLKNFKAFLELEDVDYIWISYTILFNDIPGYEKEIEKGKIKEEVQLYRRTFLLKYLVENNILDRNKKYHLLGLVNPFEFILLANIFHSLGIKDGSFIHSCDSALAYVNGKAGIVMDSQYGLIGKRAKSLEDFNEQIELDYEQQLKIMHNINVINNLANIYNAEFETTEKDNEIELERTLSDEELKYIEQHIKKTEETLIYANWERWK